CSRGGLSLPQHDGSRHELQILEWSVHRLARDVAAPIYAAAGFHDAVLRRCLRARGAALQSGERSGVPEEGAVAEAEGAWHAEHGRRDGERGGDVRMERGGDRRSQDGRLALLLPSGRLAQPRPPGQALTPSRLSTASAPGEGPRRLKVAQALRVYSSKQVCFFLLFESRRCMCLLASG
ncbi:unnamed protein product, partial [Prorocentrum cordatum]